MHGLTCRLTILLHSSCRLFLWKYIASSAHMHALLPLDCTRSIRLVSFSRSSGVSACFNISPLNALIQRRMHAIFVSAIDAASSVVSLRSDSVADKYL